LAFVLSFASLLPAQENEDSTFHGKLKFGYRAVDTSGNGADYRYRQDLNLNSGAYLRNFNLYYSPNNELKSLFDRLDVNLYNLGDEPFQSFNLNLQKYGKYQFQWDRRKSTYFYNDRYEIGGGHLYDMHIFNFDRVMDTALFKFWITKNVQLYTEYEGYTKKGESTTSLDINRVEFEFDKPVDESSREAVVGLNVMVKRWNLIAEYRVQDYKNANSFFLPGFADGGDGARYPSSLFYFNQGQPYEFKNNSYTFKLNARPVHTLTIKGIAQLSDMDMDLTYNEEAAGVNYLGRPFEYGVLGEGSFQRKIGLYDFDANWLFADRFAIVGGIRYHDFKQEGQMEVEETIPQDFAYNTLGMDAGLQFLVTSGLTLTAGYRFEERKLENLHTYTYADKTRRNGLFGNLAWQLSRAFSLNVDYQHGSYDNPYTMISPTSFDRLRGTAKLKLNSLYGTATYLYQSNKNDEMANETWEYSKNQLNLRGGFHGAALQAFIGFAYIDIKQEADRMVSYPPGWAGSPGSFPWNIMYEGKSTLWDFSLSWDFTENWKLGGYLNSYTNRGFWEIDRQMFKGYIEYLLPLGFSTEVAYRYVNFKEEMSGMNDYKANIFEFNFGYAWE
jgi:hypothetical protein